MESDLEIIDAFVDGERVDAGALKNALADPDGRAYLIDAWLLREALRQREDEEPSTGAAISSISSRPESRPERRWLVAAAIVGSLVGGYALGHLTVAPASVAPSASPTVTVGAQPAQAFPVPAATRIIQLEFHNPPGTSGGD